MGNSKDDGAGGSETHRYPTLCVTLLGKKQDEKLPVLCLVLWKSRAQSCLHGAEVWLLCKQQYPVVCVITARLKGKKNQSKPTLCVEGRLKESLNPLRKGHSSAERLQCINVGQPQSPQQPCVLLSRPPGRVGSQGQVLC